MREQDIEDTEGNRSDANDIAFLGRNTISDENQFQTRKDFDRSDSKHRLQ